MGVYGNLLTAFPELYRRIPVWTKEDKSDIRDIVGIYLPSKGGLLKRWKYSNRGSASDYRNDDQLFVSIKFKDSVHIGDYFYDPDDGELCRIMGDLNYRHPGGFVVYTTEKVTGATVDHDEKLTVKEATFA